MKLQKVFKSILRILVFAGMMCILPVFSDEVKADPNPTYPAEIKKIVNGVEESATPDLDYRYYYNDYGKNYVELLANNLIICKSASDDNTNYYPIRDKCSDTNDHIYTIRNLNIKTNYDNVAALNFVGNSNDVRLYVDGNCTISGQNMGATTGISYKGGLKILPKTGGGSHSLKIHEVYDGISFSGDAAASLILGDDNGHSLNITISSRRHALSGAEFDSYRGPLEINNGVSLKCSGGESVSAECALVDNFCSYDINGTVKLECNRNEGSNVYGAIKLYGDSAGSFKVGPYADIYLTSKGQAAVVNTIPYKLDKDALEVTILGSPKSNVENPTEPVIITPSDDSNNGYSMIDDGGNTFAKSVRIRNVSIGSESSETIPVIIDYDTFKSEAPSKTVIATDNIGSQTFFDLKVHSADDKTLTNQKLLVQYLVRLNANIILTQGIYPRRDLSAAENGSLKVLIWNNLPGNQAGPVYAVVYNQTDGAYVLNGTLDAEGTAVFTGFKLRPASTVTICK